MPFFINQQRKRTSFEPSLTQEEVSDLMHKGGIALPQALAEKYSEKNLRIPVYLETLGHLAISNYSANLTFLHGSRGVGEAQIKSDICKINKVLKGILKLQIRDGRVSLVSKDSTSYQKATAKLSKCINETRKAAAEVELIESTALLAGDKLPKLAPEIAEARRALLSGGTIQLTLPEGQ